MLFSRFVKVQMWTLPTPPPLSILCQPGIQPLPTQHSPQHPWRPHSHLPDIGPSSSPGTPAPWSSRPRLVCPLYPSKSGVPPLWGSSLRPPSNRASLEGPPGPPPLPPMCQASMGPSGTALPAEPPILHSPCLHCTPATPSPDSITSPALWLCHVQHLPQPPTLLLAETWVGNSNLTIPPASMFRTTASAKLRRKHELPSHGPGVQPHPAGVAMPHPWVWASVSPFSTASPGAWHPCLLTPAAPWYCRCSHTGTSFPAVFLKAVFLLACPQRCVNTCWVDTARGALAPGAAGPPISYARCPDPGLLPHPGSALALQLCA